MKLIFVAILFFFALFIKVSAQVYAIKVEPNFSSYNNCNVGDSYKPVLKSWHVKISDSKTLEEQYGDK